jgi:hypothetical protein
MALVLGGALAAREAVRSAQSRWRVLIVVGGLAVAFVVFAWRAIPAVVWEQRLGTTNVERATSRRGLELPQLVAVTENEPLGLLIGYGPGSYPSTERWFDGERWMRPKTPHTGPVAWLAHYGLVGLVPLALFGVGLWKASRRVLGLRRTGRHQVAVGVGAVCALLSFAPEIMTHAAFLANEFWTAAAVVLSYGALGSGLPSRLSPGRAAPQGQAGSGEEAVAGGS